MSSVPQKENLISYKNRGNGGVNKPQHPQIDKPNI